MADTSTVQKLKLANSRKRFKELQELKKKKTPKTSEDLQKTNYDPTIDSMTSSSHSSVNNEYIDTSVSNENNQPSVSLFFNNLSQNDSNINNYNQSEATPDSVMNYFDTLQLSNSKEIESNIEGSASLNISEITSNEESYPLFPQESESNSENPYVPQNKIDIFSTETRKTNEETEDISELEITNTSNLVQLEIQHSNIESLKQLSNQMAELIEPDIGSNSLDYSLSITDLEKRNLELATLLNQEQVKSEKNTIIINDLNSRISHLEKLLQEKTDMSDFQTSREISHFKEELQSHLQTIGMLVAEKTELSVSLNKFELCYKQKSTECEELQARLKASRTRVADLEKELSNYKMEKSVLKNNLDESNLLISAITQDCQNIKEQKEELAQDLLEARQKLENSLEENVKLMQSYQELNSKYALADIKLQQITNNDRQQADSDLSKVTEEKFHLEKQIANLNQLLKSITKERDESVIQYQQYAQQQNMQLNSLTKNVEQLQLENEQLILQEQNRIKHISELEKQLQNLQIEQVVHATDKNNSDYNLKNEFENVRELCVQLQMEKIGLEENLTKVTNEKDMLLKELEAKNDSLSQLEGLIEQLQGNQPDSVKLLATMESDKIAAARAVQQNKELKQYIESLEEVFLKLNNDKVELTDQVNRETRNNKDLLQKLQKTEIHLQRLTEAVEIKDRELMDVRQDMVKIKKQLFQYEQVNDLVRHYEVQDNNNQALQNELKDAKEAIMKLTNEVDILKHNSSQNEIDTGENSNNSDLTNKSQSVLVDTNVKQTNISDFNDIENNCEPLKEVSNSANILEKEIAVKYLEEKFKRTMQDIVDLKDEKQSLEHLVLQLQGETETIGEYVALYHHQRMILKQKTLEKDQQLKQLTNDREYLKSKLEKLDNLIRELVNEKNISVITKPDDFIKDSESFCEKHSKLHEEITKVKDDMVQDNNKGLEIADKIIALLTEIKSSNLVQPKENVHHCSWCSGQLITV